jgi:hypothetical protein
LTHTHVHLKSSAKDSTPDALADGRTVSADAEDVADPDGVGDARLALGWEAGEQKRQEQRGEGRDEGEQAGEKDVLSVIECASREWSRGGRVRRREELLEMRLWQR